MTSQHLSFPYTGEELRGLARGFLDQLPRDDFEYLIEHIEQHMEPGDSHSGGFELGLDLILDGLERLRTQGA